MISLSSFRNIGESLNPVFIKEMRQYFQNRRMIVFMGLLLLAQFICTLFFSSAMTFDADGDEGVAFFLLIIFAGAILSVLICSVGAEQRFAEERSDKELNYAMLTTLSPAAIIRGKLEGAMVMILCIFSMLLPFLTAAYFMRGLSAASLLLTLYLFPILVLNTLAGILAGAFGQKWVTILYFVALVNSAFGIVPLGFTLAEELMDRAALDPVFWVMLLVEYEFAFMLGVMLFLLALAVVSPPKSNRMLPAKIYLFAMPFLALAMIAPYYILFAGPDYPPEMFYVFEYLFCAFSALVLAFIALFEAPTNSIRVYMKCPRNPLGRFFHFLFSSGFSGSIILTFPILVLPVALLPFGKLSGSGDEIACGFLCIIVSFLGAVILSLILSWRTRLPLPPWLWTIIFLVVGNIAPWVPFAVNEGELDSMPLRIASMVMSQTYCFYEIIDSAREVSIPALRASLAVTGILFLILLPSIVKAFRLHRFPEETVKPPTKEMLAK